MAWTLCSKTVTRGWTPGLWLGMWIGWCLVVHVAAQKPDQGSQGFDSFKGTGNARRRLSKLPEGPMEPDGIATLCVNCVYLFLGVVFVVLCVVFNVALCKEVVAFGGWVLQRARAEKPWPRWGGDKKMD